LQLQHCFLVDNSVAAYIVINHLTYEKPINKSSQIFPFALMVTTSAAAGGGGGKSRAAAGRRRGEAVSFWPRIFQMPFEDIVLTRPCLSTVVKGNSILVTVPMCLCRFHDRSLDRVPAD
jgi:hypothetical protein